MFIFHRLALSEQTLIKAANARQLEVLKWAHSRGLYFTSTVSSRAAEAGNAEIVEWLVSIKCPFSTCAPVFAAEGGHVDVLRLIPREVFTEYVATMAVERDQLKTLEWLVDNDYPHNMTAMCSGAARRGNLEIIEWLYSRRLYSPGIVTMYALARGHAHILQWVDEVGN
jgi:hypothetical protein